jgi:methanogenic corrinoid protein MtbC1
MTAMDNREVLKSRLYQAILEGEAETAENAVVVALGEDLDPIEIIEAAMIPALREVGDRFHGGEYFLPELLLAGEAAEKVNEHLTKAIIARGQTRRSEGVVLIGTVQGDVHDIGKNIVVFLLQANGFRVIDLGRDVSPGRFVEAAEQTTPDIIGLSALMTTTLPMTRSTIALFEEVGLRGERKVIIGGGAATQEWADRCGADGFASDAVGAVELCRRLMAMGGSN